MQAERVSVWYSNPVKASSPREVMHYPTPTQVVHSQGVLRANQLTDLCTTSACTALAGSMVLLKEVHVCNAWYVGTTTPWLTLLLVLGKNRFKQNSC